MFAAAPWWAAHTTSQRCHTSCFIYEFTSGLLLVKCFPVGDKVSGAQCNLPVPFPLLERASLSGLRPGKCFPLLCAKPLSTLALSGAQLLRLPGCVVGSSRRAGAKFISLAVTYLAPEEGPRTQVLSSHSTSIYWAPTMCTVLGVWDTSVNKADPSL